MQQCKVCGGTYENTLPDGMQYFHVCPPLQRVEVERDGRRRLVSPEEVIASDKVIAERAIPRPGARNENVRQIDRSLPAEPIAEGEGAIEVSIDPAIEVK